MGNGRVRALLVEAVWRLLRWQPRWKAAERMKVKLADGASMRKKAVIALARQLGVASYPTLLWVDGATVRPLPATGTALGALNQQLDALLAGR